MGQGYWQVWLYLGASSLPPVVQVSCPPLFPRSCCRWLELTIVTPAPEDQLVLLATSPRQPTLLSRPPTPTLPQTCGRRPCSRSPPTRSSPTSCQRTTGL